MLDTPFTLQALFRDLKAEVNSATFQPFELYQFLRQMRSVRSPKYSNILSYGWIVSRIGSCEVCSVGSMKARGNAVTTHWNKIKFLPKNKSAWGLVPTSILRQKKIKIVIDFEKQAPTAMNRNALLSARIQ